MFAIALACLVAFTSNTAFSAERFNPIFARKHAISLMEAGKNRELSKEALDALLARAAELLIERGEKPLADQILTEWKETYSSLMLGKRDMGDHAPLSQWLSDVYKQIEAILGPTLCDFFHISDINVVNYTIPVVFHPHASEVWCTEHLATFPEPTCEPEWRRHFGGTKWQRDADPGATARLHPGLAPVATYWIVFGVCEAAMWGTDGTLACSPIADAVEIDVARWVAPPVAQRLWDHFNPASD